MEKWLNRFFLPKDLVMLLWGVFRCRGGSGRCWDFSLQEQDLQTFHRDQKNGKFRENQDAEISKTNKTYPVSQLPPFPFWDFTTNLANWESQICWEPKTGARTSLGLSQEKTLSLIVGERLLKCGGSDTNTLFLDYTLIDEQDDSIYIYRWITVDGWLKLIEYMNPKKRMIFFKYLETLTCLSRTPWLQRNVEMPRPGGSEPSSTILF